MREKGMAATKRLRVATVFYFAAYVVYLVLCWFVATQSWQAAMAMLSVQYCWSAWRIYELVMRSR